MTATEGGNAKELSGAIFAQLNQLLTRLCLENLFPTFSPEYALYSS